MIRRSVGEQFLLIPQHEHAQLSGRLAQHLGNAAFDEPDPYEPTIRATGDHDCGWPVHDEQPTLNSNGLPTDVFESPLPMALRLWAEAVNRVAGAGAYAQLLVSLHVLSLSSYAARNPHTPREIFELNQFQHQQVEIQTTLRRQLGLATDIPVRLGLAVREDLPAEQQLKRNHGILQAMDRVSLALCCSHVPFDGVDSVVFRNGQSPRRLVFSRPDSRTLAISPWPFDRSPLTFAVLGRTVPARRYDSDSAFCRVYSAATTQTLRLTVVSADGPAHAANS